MTWICVQAELARQRVVRYSRNAVAPSGHRFLFDLILHRSHCREDPTWKSRPGGRGWDTVKPLALHGFDTRRTVIVDDSPRKILAEEAELLVTIPAYDQARVDARAEGHLNGDAAAGRLPFLRMLVVLLVQMMGVSSGGGPAAEAVLRVRAAVHRVRLSREMTQPPFQAALPLCVAPLAGLVRQLNGRRSHT
jgi:hypothetical protein